MLQIYLGPLVGKPEIQPLAPLIGSVGQIIILLLSCQRVPLSLLLLVPPYVISLHYKNHGNIECDDSDQNLVTSSIPRGVISAIDLDDSISRSCVE